MAFLGRTAGAAALTSADIPDNSITAAKIVDGAVDFQNELGFLENKATTQNLTGTYSTERMYLNDSYTLTGDVTVTGHLALGSIADEDIIITQDGTERTITGSGTLEAGNVLQDTHRTSLTDMTGVLGSAVTGSPNLNLTTGTLGSGVTFPAGHVVQVYTKVIDSATNDSTTTSSSYTDAAGFPVLFTPKFNNSTIIFSWSVTTFVGQGWAQCYARLYDNTSGGQVGGEASLTRLDMQSNRNQAVFARWGVQFTVVIPSWGTTQHSLKVQYKSSNSQSGGFNDGAAKWPVVIWEIMS